MHILRRFLQLSLVRSIFGAVVGAFVALALYRGYQAGSTALAALLPTSTPIVVHAEGPIHPDALERVGKLARTILARLDA